MVTWRKNNRDGFFLSSISNTFSFFVSLLYFLADIATEISYRSVAMSNLLRSGASGGTPSSGSNPIGSLRSLTHLNSLRRGTTLVGGNRMTKSRSFANLSGKGQSLITLCTVLTFCVHSTLDLKHFNEGFFIDFTSFFSTLYYSNVS